RSLDLHGEAWGARRSSVLLVFGRTGVIQTLLNAARFQRSAPPGCSPSRRGIDAECGRGGWASTAPTCLRSRATRIPRQGLEKQIGPARTVGSTFVHAQWRRSSPGLVTASPLSLAPPRTARSDRKNGHDERHTRNGLAPA